MRVRLALAHDPNTLHEIVKERPPQIIRIGAISYGAEKYLTALNCRLLNVINDHVQRRVLHFNSSFDLIENFLRTAYIFMFEIVHYREVKSTKSAREQHSISKQHFLGFF